MRRILLTLAIVAIALAAAVPAAADWGHRHLHHHHHHGWGGHGHHHHHHFGYRSFGYGGFGYRPWYGGYGLSLGYSRPIFSYYRPSLIYGSGYYDPCYYGGYNGYYSPLPIGYYGYYGSTYAPASNFLGLSVTARVVDRPVTAPTAVRNLLAMSRAELLAALKSPSEPAPREAAGPIVTTIVGDKAAAKPAVRWSNAETRRKAEQYLAAGDLLFREQQFHSALQRYKLAAQTAPDMAEAYWRQGHALIATANFELASGAFKRAVALDGDVSRGGFKLDELYGAAAMAKAAHMESLAGWALARTTSSDSYFLMGVQLHYDGQADRAARYFGRAAELAGVGGGHIAVFSPAATTPAIPPVFEPAAPVVEAKPGPAVAVAAAVEI